MNNGVYDPASRGGARPWIGNDQKGSYKYYQISGLDANQGNLVKQDGSTLQASDADLHAAMKDHGEGEGLKNGGPNFNTMRMFKR